MTDKPSVLFVCVHNAGRSQMAAGLLHHLASGAIEVRSAGSAPAEHLNPAAVEAMAEVGIDIVCGCRGRGPHMHHCDTRALPVGGGRRAARHRRPGLLLGCGLAAAVGAAARLHRLTVVLPREPRFVPKCSVSASTV